MNIFNPLHNRRLHRRISPIMALPIIMTSITGSLFQVASLAGKAGDFIWLLNAHKGKFGSLDLQFIYPFLNAFGLLMLLATGINMWIKTNLRKRSNR